MTINREWRDSWRVVPASSAGMMMSAMLAYAFGAFVAPLHAEFGWSRAEIAAAVSIGALIAAAGSALIGYVTDRLGARRVAVWGAPLYCLAVASLYWIGPTIGSYLTHFAIVALLGLLCSPLIWTRAIVSRFVENRGVALSLAMCGTTVAGLVAPLIATFFIVHWGWRVAYLGLATFLLVIVCPLVFAYFYDARDLRDRNESLALTGASPSVKPELTGMSAAETFRTGGFWLLIASAILGGAAVNSVTVHLIPLLQDRGLPPMQAAAGMSLVSVTAIIGRLGSGYFLDRISAAVVAAVPFSLAILACMIFFAGATSAGVTLSTSALLGFSLGTALNVLPYVTARCFGVKAYATVYGLVLAAFIVGAAALPPILGQLYERDGNYGHALILWALVFFLSAAALAFVKVPSRRPAPQVLTEGEARSPAL
jgi:MFS family permease